MPTINMLSSADKVEGHGVLSAYLEQVNLVRNGLGEDYEVKINTFNLCDITHYHTIDFKFFLNIPFSKLFGTNVAYVHFVPETIEESLNLPSFIKKIFYKYIIWFYKSVDHLVVVNPYFINVLKKYAINENKVTYIPNFVSEDNFYRYDKEKINTIKQMYNIPLEKFVVLGVGQVQTRKGVMDFIEVARTLPHIQFIWAGGFSFGSITDGYKELKWIFDNPPENVKFLGIINRNKMNDIYNICDLMFLPSYNELFPMSILEAMALKTPILLRELDIYHDILFDYYLKGKDIIDFSQIILSLEKKDNKYETWCNNSWKCHEFYSKSYVLKMWKDFYDDIYYHSNKKLRSTTNEK
ncbi:1,2-diacylglycerol-3-alpha-glucose alpha-1,2-galactosyltransferase [Clostridium cavendishii DSM 21758]|uniref:1,2-diacylglycerol-3-alpha-glucose alpha-1,2-galactosyltransferase n=1 Tax=Clostridium cavendishii DSM 21758 TaxID=1121302 RepID=A0A1M6RAI7_9CLOT|nr:glycosyltransferase [Clostridium cavendishii]SHK29471.1 1,2-diacylglycerol-3-alpha-glucose alpha-1,2-galactosyltransferase [Clostridium cavendishii DSM 21758]